MIDVSSKLTMMAAIASVKILREIVPGDHGVQGAETLQGDDEDNGYLLNPQMMRLVKDQSPQRQCGNA